VILGGKFEFDHTTRSEILYFIENTFLGYRFGECGPVDVGFPFSQFLNFIEKPLDGGNPGVSSISRNTQKENRGKNFVIRPVRRETVSVPLKTKMVLWW
jgi:hypothetical protein